jgi:hypothetical protein
VLISNLLTVIPFDAAIALNAGAAYVYSARTLDAYDEL